MIINNMSVGVVPHKQHMFPVSGCGFVQTSTDLTDNLVWLHICLQMYHMLSILKWVWLMTKVGLLDYVLYNNIQLVGVAPCKPAKSNGHGFVFTGDPWLSDPCTLVYLKQELTVLLEYFEYRCVFH